MSSGIISRVRRSYRANVFLLAAAQCVYVISSSGHAMFSGLAGAMLAPSPALATLPISLIVIGTVITAIPMSLLMRRIGRRAGFLLGAAFGIAGAMVAAWALAERSFVLFSMACALQGVYQAATLYYRYAALEIVPETYRGRAVAYVIGGGLVAAFITPDLLNWANNLSEPLTFAGAYAVMVAAGVLAVAILSTVALHVADSHDEASLPSRPLGAIIRQPGIICAVVNATAAYALMILLMTAAPLAIVGCGFSAGVSARAIRWHVVAMFLPSFVSGRLIDRFGVFAILIAGAIAFIISGIIATFGLEIANFKLSLAAAGIGWNLMLTGATALLVQSHRPSERAKVQALNEFTAWGFSVVASFAAGGLIETVGWNAVAIVASSVAAATLVLTLLLLRRKRVETAVETI